MNYRSKVPPHMRHYTVGNCPYSYCSDTSVRKRSIIASPYASTCTFVPLTAYISVMVLLLSIYASSSYQYRMSRGFLIHKLAAKMLALWARCGYDHPDDEACLLGGVPQDVKKGHFVVYAVEGGELRRFVLNLSYLAHPGFLKLLEQAETEFGFKQAGILAIPCRYSDLVSLLQSNK
ncbi:hypothetical protein SASPL_124734 [Salvia splendens]|uniref:SAUR family protein n=1 Tax=Salvia splendens TaxID=180675 RepID=A0A8X8XH78_SALSN|nr:hypothetical protein SASPL_124734 [Salvia splendens]